MKNLILMDEAAKEMHLDTASLIRRIISEELDVLINFDELDLEEEVELLFSQKKTDLFSWLDLGPINKIGQSMLTKNSFFKYSKGKVEIPFDEYDDFFETSYYSDENKSSVTATPKGVWTFNHRYLKRCLSERVFPLLNLNQILPFGVLYNPNFLSVNSSSKINNHDYSLYISNEAFNQVFNLALDGENIVKKKNYSYSSQRDAQKERHAVKRESVLMAAISVFKRFPDECSKSSTRWGAMLWKHADEYWEGSSTPLSQDEIVKLLRKASKAP